MVLFEDWLKVNVETMGVCRQDAVRTTSGCTGGLRLYTLDGEINWSETKAMVVTYASFQF